jgi:ABC-2 type transport system permease protein
MSAAVVTTPAIRRHDVLEGPMKTVRDTWLIYRRSLMLTLRNPVWVMVGLTQPIFFLLLFGPVLEGMTVAQGGSGRDAYNAFVPGLLIYLAMFTMFVGFGLIAEMRAGVVERMRVTPVSRVAMLLGRTLRDVTVLVAQALLLVVLSVPFGLQVDPEGAALGLVLVGLVGLCLAPLSYALGLVTRNEDSFAPVVQLLLLPLLLLSGVLLPLTFAPDWLQWLAELNPLSYAVDASRALFEGHFDDPVVATGALLIGAIAAASIWIGSRAFGRAAA